MKIEKIPLKELKQYKNNAKKHPQEQIDEIIESIKKYGFNDPIAVDENNMIIEGHGRYEALRQMGKKYAPCIVLSHLTKQQKRAYIIAHNKINMDSGFDIELLKKELKVLSKEEMSFLDFDDNLFEDALLVSDEDFVQGTEIVKNKFNITIKCKDEEDMKKKEKKLKKAGWI